MTEEEEGGTAVWFLFKSRYTQARETANAAEGVERSVLRARIEPSVAGPGRGARSQQPPTQLLSFLLSDQQVGAGYAKMSAFGIKKKYAVIRGIL